jgi:hypothetical protein
MRLALELQLERSRIRDNDEISAGSKIAASAAAIIHRHFYQPGDLVSGQIAGIGDVGLLFGRVHVVIPRDDPLAPLRVTMMFPNAVEICVAEPSPILKETPTGL